MKILIKLFYKSISRMICLAVLFLGQAGYTVYTLLEADDVYLRWGAVNAFGYQERIIYYLFLIMLFLSFDYYREIHDNQLYETACSSGRTKLICRQIIILVITTLLYSAEYCFINMFIFYKSKTLNLQVINYLFRHAFIFVFLNGILAIFIALALSFVQRKIIGYIILMLIAVFFGPMSSRFLEVLSGVYSVNGGFLYLSRVLPDDYKVFNIYSLTTSNIMIAARILFWSMLFISVAVCFMCTGKKKILTAIPVVLSVLLCVFAARTDYSFYHYDDSSYLDNDSRDYNMVYYLERENDTENVNVDFRVDSYDMNMSITNQLEVEAKLKIIADGCKTYCFTLYHRYNITDIKDEDNNNLKYDRNGDHVTIFAEKELSEIKICYEGGCPEYYSSYDQIFLPGCFAYYPVPGMHKIYDVDNFKLIDNSLDSPCSFNITIKSGSKIYSNLEEKNNNRFTGVTTCPTFISGFVKEYKYNDITLIAPYLAVETALDNGYLDELTDYVVMKMKEKGYKKLIIMQGTHMPAFKDSRSIVYNNTIMSLACNIDATGDPLSNNYKKSDLSKEMQIKQFTFNYMINKDSGKGISFDTALNIFKKNIDVDYKNMSESDLFNMFKEFIITEYGEEEWDYLIGK